MYVSAKKENLRETPNGQILGVLSSGTKVEVLEKQQNWVKVNLTAWIWEASLTDDRTRVSGFSVMANHILVETEAEAKVILSKIKDGEPFDDLAKNHSIDANSSKSGGNLGVFKRGDFFPEFEDAVFNLKVGEISAVIHTKLGFHIIKRTK